MATGTTTTTNSLFAILITVLLCNYSPPLTKQFRDSFLQCFFVSNIVYLEFQSENQEIPVGHTSISFSETYISSRSGSRHAADSWCTLQQNFVLTAHILKLYLNLPDTRFTSERVLHVHGVNWQSGLCFGLCEAGNPCLIPGSGRITDWLLSSGW